MKIVIAPDSFKECATAPEVAEAIAAGWRRVLPDTEIVRAPMADGGEGTVDALVAATGGERITAKVADPLGNPVRAQYGLIEGGKTAVIEMAAASGLALVPPDRRDPRVTSTRGTGELIRHALDMGARDILIGIGGSATNDGGAGMAQALGYRLLDADGAELPPGGAALARLARIDASGKHPALAQCRIRVACDVDNPLCGPHGASAVYGPQKGASQDVVLELDAALRHFGKTIERQLGVRVLDLPGGGAAGGLGAGLIAFAGATLESGVALVAEACRLAEKVRGADLVITGEGQIDGQTAHGKTPAGVARIAKELGVPVVAFAGSLGDGYQRLYEHGFDAIFSICPGPMTMEEAVRDGLNNLSATVAAAARAMQIKLPFANRTDPFE